MCDFILAFCFEKVMKETEEMNSIIEEKLGLDPVDKSVIVLYEGEKQEQVRRISTESSMDFSDYNTESKISI